MNLTTTVKLNNGVEIPWVGLGVFKSEPGEETAQAVRWALEIGYRHIDTAALYANEESVGTAIRESGVDRDDIFVTTKVWNTDQGYETTLAAFDESRKKLQMDVVDLYLVHWPVKGKYLETWRALEKLYADGKVRAIGVSNFLEHHLADIARDFDVTPAVNQVEFHPFLVQQHLLDYDTKHGIRHEAWSPMVRGQRLDDPNIAEIAAAHGKSAAQVMLRWDLHLGVVTIPKSVHRERILENSQIFDFELTPDEVNRITGLDEEARIGPHPDKI